MSVTAAARRVRSEIAKVRLTFRTSDLHQVSVRQLDRLSEDGASDRDLIMASQGADDAIGRVVDGRELFTKLSKRGGLDLADQVG